MIESTQYSMLFDRRKDWGLSVDHGSVVYNCASFFNVGIDLSEVHISKKIRNKYYYTDIEFSFYSCKHPLKKETEQETVFLVDSSHMRCPITQILLEFEPYRSFKQIPFAHQFLEAGFEEMIYYEEISSLNEMAILYSSRE